MKPFSFIFSSIIILGGITGACTTETRIVHEAADPTLPTGSTTDAPPPPPGEDATEPGPMPTDAGSQPPHDGSTASDALSPPSPPPASDVGRVNRSASGGAPLYCPTGNVCCVQNAVKQLAPIALTCDTFNGCKGRPDPLPLTCDGPEDCKAGESCWAIATPQIALTSLCSAAAISPDWKRLCNPGAAGECAAGESCVATTSAPAVGVCR